MKTCSKCRLLKTLEAFNRDKTKKDGREFCCKTCKKQYRQDNKLALQAYQRKRYNAETKKAYQQAYRKIHKDVLNKKHNEYKKSNKDKINAANAKRRAIQLRAMPRWLTPQDIEELSYAYQAAFAFSLYTGEKYHVDHIIPLQGKLVCGLHVPWNLQVLPAKENLKKGNR